MADLPRLAKCLSGVHTCGAGPTTSVPGIKWERRTELLAAGHVHEFSAARVTVVSGFPGCEVGFSAAVERLGPGDGILAWGVKPRFLRYVAALPDGRSVISAEVRLLGRAGYAFPLVGATGSAPTTLRFAGEVLFCGHGGMLRVRIAEPWLEYDAGTWRLTGSLGDRARVLLASGFQRIHERLPLQVEIPMQLAVDAVPLFGGTYGPGEPMSDLVLLCGGVRPVQTPERCGGNDNETTRREHGCDRDSAI